MVLAISAFMVLVPAAPGWAEPAAAVASADEGSPMIAFLTWWTAASIIVCSGISAIVVHLNYRVH
jgi:hypothetical protein